MDRQQALVSRRSRLSAEKQALLDKRLRGQLAGGTRVAPPLPVVRPCPEERHAPFPLTDIQHAYWLGRSGAFELGNVGCHAYLECDSGDLDLARFTAAWRYVVARHDMLRAIVCPDGRQQVLEDVPPYEIEVLDLRGAPAAVVASELEAVRDRMSHQVLPSERWPLFEIRATRFDPGTTRLHVSLDLLISDIWSTQTLLREIVQLYHDPETILPPLGLSFRDYVLAQLAWRDSDAYHAALDYWRGRLGTLPSAPELPLAAAPGSLVQPRFVRREGRLEPAAWSRLRRQAASAGLTPSGVLLAAFAEVLGVWSGPRFTINLTLFNRLPVHPEIFGIVGDFTTTILLEVDGAAPTFAARARGVQQQMWADLDHAQVSGVQVLRELARARRSTSGAAMPVVFTSALIQSSTEAQPLDQRAPWEVTYVVSQTPQVWLDHQVREVDGALLFSWDAIEALFPPGMLDDMFDAQVRLLEHLTEDAAAWTEPTRQLVPTRQLALRDAANATDTPVTEGLLQSAFEARATERPDAAAVIAPGRTLTYGDLRRAANRVGRRLREVGARPNTLVAIVMEKGWEQVVAALGVLEAGAAYLPIDPALPPERLNHLLADAEVRVALTQARVNECLTWPDGVTRLVIDDETAWAVVPADALAPVQQAGDLAYVIYTSGSTGVPKGVMIDHRGAVNTIADVNRRFAVGPADRVLALSSLSFDLSVYDVFGTLAAGGTIVVPDPGAARDPSHWLALLDRERVTIWNSVPALMEMLVEHAEGVPPPFPSTLRLVMLSGDWVPMSLPDRIRALAPAAQVVSLGGATEASVWSVLYPIETVDPEWKSIPYGKPMANQRLHVLDAAALAPCPVWVPGQLYIGGLGLARGYWHDEAKTATSFITHPRTRERLYWTGDLGRYLPDGNIEFLGRADFQVKIQGYRIELGEIETVLAQHPAVQAVMVAAVGDRGNKRLVAHVVPAPERTATPTVPAPANGGSPSVPLAGGGDLVELDTAAFVLDPMERLQFRLEGRGRRHDRDRAAVVLPAPVHDAGFTAPFLARRTYRAFHPEPILLAQLADLLGCLVELDLPEFPFPKLRYPSAGDLYPVQTYLHVKAGRVAGLEAGLYYHDRQAHRLVVLGAGVELERTIHFHTNQGIFDSAGFSLFLVAELAAIAPLYGTLAREFCLLEAGYMGQLLMTEAPAQRLGLCPIGAMAFASVGAALGLGESQVLVHSFLGGRIAAEPAGTRPEAVAVEVVLPTAPAASEGRDAALVATLREFLREKLPAYMVPAAFVVLEALPLTPNGKVDRRAVLELPAPAPAAAYLAPRTDLERVLTGFLQELLELERVGVHDNFFDLGATSVQVVQVHRRLREVLGREVPIVTMFQHATVAALAKHLSDDGDDASALDAARDRATRQQQAIRQRQRAAAKERE